MIEVELPDGSIAEFPDDMPPEQIEATLRQQFQPATPQPQASPLRPAAVFSQSVLEGAANVVDSLLNTPNQIANLLKAAAGYPMIEYGTPGMREFAQENLQPSPNLPIASRALEAAGGVSEEFQPRTQAEQRISTVGQTIGGAAASGGISPQAPLASLASAAGAGAGIQTAREVAPGSMPAEIVGAVAGGLAPAVAQRIGTDAANRFRALYAGAPDEAAAAAIQEGRRTGVPVMTSDVLPPKTFFGRTVQATTERIPIAGTGKLREVQAQARIDAAKEAIAEYGQLGAFDDVIATDLAQKRAGELTKYVSLKNQVKEQLSPNMRVKTPNAAATIDTELARLERLGPAVPERAKEILRSFKSSIQGKRLDEIEDVRKLLGEQLKEPELAGSRDLLDKIAPRVYGSLKQDIEGFVGQAGGKPALRKWQVANERLAQMAGESANKKLRNALNQADETPEAIRSMLFSTKPSDVQRLYRGLTDKGRAAGRAAIINEAVEKAGGMENLNPDTFSRILNNRLKTAGSFFSEQQLKQAEGLKRLLDATQRAPGASLFTTTGAQLSVPVGAAVLTDLSGGVIAGLSTGAAVGGLARAYESAPMRNYLLRLASLKKGTKAYNDHLAKGLAAIAASQQVQQNP